MESALLKRLKDDKQLIDPLVVLQGMRIDYAIDCPFLLDNAGFDPTTSED